MGAGTINGLLDELLEKKVLNQEEMERIKFVNATVMDKARDLCDSVTKKGPLASQIFITYICNEDCYLAGVLELESGKSLIKDDADSQNLLITNACFAYFSCDLKTTPSPKMPECHCSVNGTICMSRVSAAPVPFAWYRVAHSGRKHAV